MPTGTLGSPWWTMSAPAYYRLITGSLHPEWLDLIGYRRLAFHQQTLTAGVFPGGHLWIWSLGSHVLTELVGPTRVPWIDVPRLQFPLTHGRRAKSTWPDQLAFETTCQIETLPEAIFESLSQETIRQSATQGWLTYLPANPLPGSVSPAEPKPRSTRQDWIWLSAEPVQEGMLLSAVYALAASRTWLQCRTLLDFTRLQAAARVRPPRGWD